MIYYGDSLSSLSLASELPGGGGGGFPYSVEHMAGQGHVLVNRLKPHAPIYVYTEHAQFVDVSEVDNGGVQWEQFLRDEGCTIWPEIFEGANFRGFRG